MAESKEESLKHLNTYLSGWYEGNRKIGNLLIDTHLNQDPKYGGYIGYWSFESAAVAYLKDLDETSLRQYLYYPKDIWWTGRGSRSLSTSRSNTARVD